MMAHAHWNPRPTSSCLTPVIIGLALTADGMTRAGTIHVPDDYPAIQAAINAAQDGDEIIVHRGTYSGKINLTGKAITVRSSDGPDATVLDGLWNGPILTCDSGEGPDTVIEGFTVTHGAATFGAGMLNHSADPTVIGCIFRENVAASFGGGMYNSFSSPILSDCVFASNVASHGAGLCNNNDCNPVLTDCTFSENRAHELQTIYGSGLCNLGNSNPVLLDCRFIANDAEPWGHGAGIYNSNSDSLITSCVFVDNDADSAGGIFNTSGSSPVIHDCEFVHNTCDSSGGAVLNLPGCDTVITECHFTDNHAHRGGAIGNFECNSTIERCLFLENVGSLSGGGAIHNEDDATPLIISCRFLSNKGVMEGGAISSDRADTTLINCLFCGNDAGWNGGGAVYLTFGSTTLINCSIASNTADHDGGGGCMTDHGDLLVVNSICWDNQPDEINAYLTTPSVKYSCVKGGYPGQGNIDDDPKFVNILGPDGEPGTDDDDLRLRQHSPCIDAGDNQPLPPSVVEDLDGNPRRVDDPYTDDTGHGVPPLIDMGAYEFQPTACPADIDEDGVVGVLDLLLLLAAWGECPDCPEDLTHDGIVDVLDLLEVLAAWGPCP